MDQLIDWLTTLATQVPLEVFVFLGTMIEELIAPIPTPVILGTAGYIAHQAGSDIPYLIWLAVIGAIAKTVASYIFYLIGLKAGQLFVTRWGKYFGMTLPQLHHFSRMMNKGIWDDVLLVGIRIIPIVPTFIVSLACGTLHVKPKTFIWTTVLGSAVRNFLILLAGAYGTSYAQSAWETTGKETFSEPLMSVAAVVGLVIGGGIALFLRQRFIQKTQP